jgi:hypothetical protein
MKYMNITQAIEILEHYKQEECLPHMLETLQYIDEHYSEQEPLVKKAFDVFMLMGRKMFSPV